MSELREFFDERKGEVEQFFIFLEQIETDANYNSNIIILKSQAILMLYNLIEGTVNKGIEYIFDTIGDEALKHNQISSEIRVMWLRYFKLHLDDNGQNIETLQNIEKLLNDIVEINISQFRKNNSSYFSSGTLDSVSIKKILKKFSIECTFFEYQLKFIKEDRNFLAHGEKSFTEVSQNKTLPSLIEDKNKVIAFLDKYVEVIEAYINNEKYKI